MTVKTSLLDMVLCGFFALMVAACFCGDMGSQDSAEEAFKIKIKAIEVDEHGWDVGVVMKITSQDPIRSPICEEAKIDGKPVNPSQIKGKAEYEPEENTLSCWFDLKSVKQKKNGKHKGTFVVVNATERQKVSFDFGERFEIEGELFDKTLRCKGGRSCKVTASLEKGSIRARADKGITLDVALKTGSGEKVPLFKVKKGKSRSASLDLFRLSKQVHPTSLLKGFKISVLVDAKNKEGDKSDSGIFIRDGEVGQFFSSRLKAVKGGKGFKMGSKDKKRARAKGLLWYRPKDPVFMGSGSGLDGIDLVVFESIAKLRKGDCGTYRKKSGETKTIDKSMYDMKYTVRDRRTGTKVAEKVFKAPTPRCPKEAFVIDTVHSAPKEETVRRYLETFVKK